MNEIEELAKKHLQGIERLVRYTGCDSSEVDSYKTDLKRLIELVENEQVKECSYGTICDKKYILDAPRVSKNINWEKL